MKKSEWKRYLLLAALLASVCVGAVELWVCAYQAPEVYAAITAPLRSAVRQAEEAGEAAWAGLSRRFDTAVARGVSQVQDGLQRLDRFLDERLNPPPEEPQEEQEIKQEKEHIQQVQETQQKMHHHKQKMEQVDY